MSIPSGFVNELLARVSLARVAGQHLNWDSRKSNPSRGDYWACCPFHEEKTPSFHLDDRKGFYYCFGCQEKGNAISFVRKIRNLGYRETIEVLAQFAGMTVPAFDIREAEAEKQRISLYEVCEKAADYFRKNLASQAGFAAREYLLQRGVAKEAQKQFEIGFASNERYQLTNHLQAQGISLNLLSDAGLTIVPDDGGAPFDRFRNRIIFPIRDLRDRMTAFGGRSLDPSARAKYLNSPETDIFSKGTCLYNHKAAQDALSAGQPLVIAEGYMDVIALSDAGISASVAPLGTSITEHQIRHLWRMADFPVLALDGDMAGFRAATKTMQLALPLLEPGKSLRFCFLPENKDPDDFLKEFGRSAMLALIEKSMRLDEFLWQNTLNKRSLDSPENRASFEAELLSCIATIRDISVRRQYNQQFRNRLFEFGRSRSSSRNGTKHRKTGGGPTRELRSTVLAAGRCGDGVDVYVRESTILGICLCVPDVIDRVRSRLEQIELTNGKLRQILDSILLIGLDEPIELSSFCEMAAKECGEHTINQLTSSKHLFLLRKNSDGSRTDIAGSELIKRAELMLTEELNKLDASRAAIQEMEEAARDAKEGAEIVSLSRFAETVAQRERARSGADHLLDHAWDSIPAENGVAMDKGAVNELDQLFRETQQANHR